MKLTLEGSATFVCECGMMDDNIPADAGFHFDHKKRYWWTVDPRVAKKLLHHADEKALKKLGYYVKLDKPGTCKACRQVFYWNYTGKATCQRCKHKQDWEPSISTCEECGSHVKPNMAPMNRDGSNHFATCTNADEFRTRGAKKKPQQKKEQDHDCERQTELF